MKTRSGFVIEFNVRAINGKLLPNCVLSSKQFGEETFNDLTDNSRDVFVDRDIEGFNHKEDVPVTYDRAFVVIN